MLKRSVDEKVLLLSRKSPLLLLAEKVEGSLLNCNINNDKDEDGCEEDVDEEVEEGEEENEEKSEEEDGDEEEVGEEGEEEEYEYHDDEEDYGDHEDQVDKEDEDMEVEDEESGEEDIGVSGDEDMEVDEEENVDEDIGVAHELQVFDENWAETDSDQYLCRYYQLRVSVGSARGIYSMSRGRLYRIELPEAADKVIVGANKGWMMTVGKDLKTSLLHPLFKKEITLPSMHVFRDGSEYISYDGVSIDFLRKDAMSTDVQPNKNLLRTNRPDPPIMIIYEESGYLGFARPGDKVWAKVNITWSGPFTDIAYHMGKFYSLNYHGSTFVCHIEDDTNGRHATGTRIVKCPLIKPADGDIDEKYLIGLGCDLWLVVHLRKIRCFKPTIHTRVMYCTTGFLVWMLEENITYDGLGIVCTRIPRRTLDNKAFFIGLNSSVSLPSSGCISFNCIYLLKKGKLQDTLANCIYFTNDTRNLYFSDGGGHDVGVFNAESVVIIPRFQGKSIHPVCPPLWCI